ncbi:MAG: C10 family peptidase [Bacteroidales bacterium]
MDPVTNQRSIAGCPAVAMAQIVNYYETINETVFSDIDDYYHSYAGRNYWIDDDFEELDFPDFSQLNAYLDTLVGCWLSQSSLKNNEKAALNFACGIAYTRFTLPEFRVLFELTRLMMLISASGFSEAMLMDDSDTSLYTKLAQNMLDARPAHLAVVDPGWTMGHNVVVDGYTEEGYFHLNFGWNGSYNGFYLLPDEIPYGLTVIEGVVLNIGYPPVYTNVFETGRKRDSNKLSISPNPAVDNISINLHLQESGIVNIRIYDQLGKLVSSTMHTCQHTGSNTVDLNFNQLTNSTPDLGIYFCTARLNNELLSGKFIVR